MSTVKTFLVGAAASVCFAVIAALVAVSTLVRGKHALRDLED